MNVLKILMPALAATAVGGVLCAQERPPTTNFEGVLSQFGANVEIPLTYEWLSAPGVETKEIYIRRPYGHWDIVVFGQRRGEWIGFVARSRVSLETRKFVVEFEEIVLPKDVKPAALSTKWVALVDVLKAPSAVAPADTAPYTSLFERSGGGVPSRVAHAKTYFVTDPKHHAAVLGELLRTLGVKH